MTRKKRLKRRSIKLRPAPLDLDILFEDEHLAIVNKPAGLVVHPGAGTKDTTLIEGFIHYLQNKEEKVLFCDEQRPGMSFTG